MASVAQHFRALGVKPGDRVAAVLANTDCAMIAFLATASIGAIWSLCAPDMGHVGVLDRFRQIEPKLLIAQDGYVHAGKMIDRRDYLKTITDGLPTLKQTILLPAVGPASDGTLVWGDLTGDDADLSCSIPDDHIDPRRSALFMARSVLRDIREHVQC